jgi:hypothetical protein
VIGCFRSRADEDPRLEIVLRLPPKLYSPYITYAHFFEGHSSWITLKMETASSSETRHILEEASLRDTVFSSAM